MAQQTIGNEPAFSKAAFYCSEGGIDSPQEGLSKREYFAAMAIQGILSNINSHSHSQQRIAIDAVDMADELIKILNK